jgi:hypothetical protein
VRDYLNPDEAEALLTKALKAAGKWRRTGSSHARRSHVDCNP